jgi:hypothetical protein
MFPPIFRERSLQRLSAPEQLDQMLHVTSTRGWFALAGLCCLTIAGLLLHSARGIPIVARGKGLLIRQGGAFRVQATGAGQVVAFDLAPGDLIPGGAPVATVRGQGDTLSTVRTPFAARVLEVLTTPGALVERGSPLVSVEPGDRPLEAVVYVAPADGKQIVPGATEARIALSTVRTEEYGFLLGRVASVSAYPVSEEGVMARLQNGSLARSLTSGGPVLEVRVTLMPDPASGSGLQWTSQGPPPNVSLSSGTLCTATFVLSRHNPVGRMLPAGGQR